MTQCYLMSAILPITFNKSNNRSVIISVTFNIRNNRSVSGTLASVPPHVLVITELGFDLNVMAYPEKVVPKSMATQTRANSGLPRRTTVFWIIIHENAMYVNVLSAQCVCWPEFSYTCAANNTFAYVFLD